MRRIMRTTKPLSHQTTECILVLMDFLKIMIETNFLGRNMPNVFNFLILQLTLLLNLIDYTHKTLTDSFHNHTYYHSQPTPI